MMALFHFLVLSLCISCYEVDAGSKIQPERQQSFSTSQGLKSNLPTKDNDFECVDIHKQPAFSHPLLKNHKIQLKPTFAQDKVLNRSSYVGKALKVSSSIKGCPLGTVPIHKMTIGHQMSTNSSKESHAEDFRQYSQSYPGHHLATVDTTQNMTYHGARAAIGLYDLSLQPNQYSFSQIWLQNGPLAKLNIIKAGCAIHPSLYGDSQIRITSYWTADGYQKTGCFNALCPGFVQIHQILGLGSPINPPRSIIGSRDKVGWYVKVKQDQSTGHWWLMGSVDDVAIGYWPKEIFTYLGGGSSLIRYGGETFAPSNMASPPMGSGRLPKELFRNSGFMAELQIVDSEYKENDVNHDEMKIYTDSSSNCYDVLYHGYEGPVFKQAFLYGGPGGQCGI